MFWQLIFTMPDCLFCKIVAGKIPSYKLTEGSQTFAFLDVFPVSKGHALIVPKRHVEDLRDLTAEEWMEIGRLTQSIGNAEQKGLKADGFSLLLRNGKAAGQEVPHVHFHLIPRFHGDALEEWRGKKMEKGELEKTVKMVKEKL